MKTTMTTTIDAPANVVFLWLEDSERLKKWVPNLVEDESIKETPNKIGSKFRQVFDQNGKSMEMIGEITEFEKDSLLRAFLQGDMFSLDVAYRFKAINHERTEVTQDTEMQIKGFMKFIAPIFLFISKFSSKNPQALAHAKLKEMAEQEYQSM